METQVKLREQIKVSQLESNFADAMDTIENMIIDNDYILKMDGNRIEDFDLRSIKLDFSNVSRNARKNLAKRIHFFYKKRTLKSINTLFLVFRYLGVIDKNIKVEISIKEKNINRLRRVYKLMRAKTEEARLDYKKEKGDFYK